MYVSVFPENLQSLLLYTGLQLPMLPAKSFVYSGFPSFRSNHGNIINSTVSI